MSKLTYRYYTLRTVVPNTAGTSDELRKIDERATDLAAIGEDGWELVSTITLDRSDDVTLIIDTFKRPEL
jgi:hypothetical protein